MSPFFADDIITIVIDMEIKRFYFKDLSSHFLNSEAYFDYYVFDNVDNPPSKYEKVHDKFLAIYKNLNKLKNLCNSPEGSLQSFSSNVNNLLSDIQSDLKETDLTIESDSKMMSKYIDEFTESLETIRKVQKD